MISPLDGARRPLHVVFVCTGNSARSILAEVLLRDLGGDRFVAASAGSHPTGRVHPIALETLAAHGHSTAGLRSKSWDEFAAAGAADLDLVITVCDNAASEACPIWPGAPTAGHWGAPDPAAETRSEELCRAAFARVYALTRARIERLVAVRFESLDGAAMSDAVRKIGESRPTDTQTK